MPGKVGVKIKAGRNLPVMDKSSDTTDAYVEIKLGNVTHKTDVCRKSLNPQWNTDWFRFEVDDAELQDEPLQIRLMDHDTYSANDAIGKVNISLNPLCLETSGQTTHGKGTVLSGWIPVFDTMHGIRGEVNVIVKVDLFSDANKFRQSSCGIPFFHSPCIPVGYRAQVIHGFVEELVVNDDPEYQWIDKIRTPRASNEARQVVFLKLSGQVQRKMGLKAINMGANAVIAYTQCFDLEGDVGVVARGIGTAVTLIKDTTAQIPSNDNALIEERTLKYIEFITAATVRPQPFISLLSLNKLCLESSEIVEEKSKSDTEPEYDSQVMLDLIRQEEGRGLRRIKKLGRKMRYFTNSSRNLFNEKCNTYMRKIDENSSSSGSRSLTGVGLFPRRGLKPPSQTSSMLDIRKPQRWLSSHSDVEHKPPKGLSRTIHPIVRSVSDDSSMKQTGPDQSKRSLHSVSLYGESEKNKTSYNRDKQPGSALSSGAASQMGTIEDIANENIEYIDDETDSGTNSCALLVLPSIVETASLSSRNCLSQPDLCNPPQIECNPPCAAVHSQSLGDVNACLTASAYANHNNNATHNRLTNNRPASIVLVNTPASEPYSHPVLKICPSTPTPSESDSLVSSNIGKMPHSEPKSSSDSDSFPFSQLSAAAGDSVSCAALSNNSLSSSANTLSNLDCTLDRCSTTNSNANNSLLVPFICNNAGILITAQKHHRQHRSLADIANNSGSNSSHTDSPNVKRTMSPAPAAMSCDDNGSVTKTNIASGNAINSNKLSPSPTRSGLTTTAATNQSQSDSLSSATTISTATTIIPKEVGEMCRRSSDSDLSVTPKGNSFCVASDRLMAATAMMRLGPTVVGKNANNEGLDMMEYPFLTLTKYPPGLILHIGATVAARSVKLLERVPNPDEPEIRDSWWTELRMEIRSHARSLGCNVVLGYSELTTISDDVCVLSATGTAAIINMGYNRSISQNDIFTMPKPTAVAGMSASLEERNMTNSDPSAKESNGSIGKKNTGLPPLTTRASCTICHVPYNVSSIPFNVKMKRCAICNKGRVPDVLLATLEVPDAVQVTGRGCFLQAQVVRAKKDLRSESNAKEISDGLPFLEYELHRVLINKLKAKGMNAIFGLKVQVSIGERMIALVATGTALFLTALPVPQVPKIVAGNSWTDKQKLNELQKKLQETYERYQDIYQLKPMDQELFDKNSDTDESDEEGVDVDLNCGNKDTCVLEVDDIEDLEIISLLMEPQPPEGFHVVSTQRVPGLMDMDAVKNLQMFTQVWRAKTDTGQSVSGFPKHFQRLLQTIYFKLRTMIPCAICDLQFKLDFPESDQIQILVTGMALGLSDPNKIKYKRKTATNGQVVDNFNDHPNTDNVKRKLHEEDYIFPLDEDQMVETPTPANNIPMFGAQIFKNRKSSPIQLTTAPGSVRLRHHRSSERNGVDITPLSFVPGGKIEKYLGNLNFFFIRESTSIREIGGISGFVHGFVTELLAVVRAHIAALGGNAMVSFYLSELILFDNQHKNQGQCLISIGGDAVSVAYQSDD